MAIQGLGLGSIVECERCGEEFELNYLHEEELDDFDEYFEHVTTCGE